MNATQLSLFEWGRKARPKRAPRVWLRPDGSVLLEPAGPDWGKLPREVREVHFHPRKDRSFQDVLDALRGFRANYPEARIHGFSPGWLQRHGRACLPELQEAGLDSLCWFTGDLNEAAPAAQGWEACAGLPIAKIASFVYGPEASMQALEARVKALSEADQIVPLPRAVGDLVVIRGATTDGTLDIEVLARCRVWAQSSQRVRASWGALGFKLAQSSLAFGADALAGWGMEEQLAYSGRMRPADLIGLDEARAGVWEAGMEFQ